MTVTHKALAFFAAAIVFIIAAILAFATNTTIPDLLGWIAVGGAVLSAAFIIP